MKDHISFVNVAGVKMSFTYNLFDSTKYALPSGALSLSCMTELHGCIA